MVAEGHSALGRGRCGLGLSLLGVGNFVALQVMVEVAALLVLGLDSTWLVLLVWAVAWQGGVGHRQW